MNVVKVPYLPIPKIDKLEIESGLEEQEKENEDETLTAFLDELKDTAEGRELATLGLILHGLGLPQLIKNFQKEGVTLETFFNLTDSDLDAIGVTDPKQKKIILKNIKEHDKGGPDLTIKFNCQEDLKIAKNVYNQLIFLKNYSSYIELQLRKVKLVDYRVNSMETASYYLKIFIEDALTQCTIMNEKLFKNNEVENLIGKTLEINNLTLPPHLKNKLHSKKKQRKGTIPKLLVTMGISSIIFVILKNVLR